MTQFWLAPLCHWGDWNLIHFPNCPSGDSDESFTTWFGWSMNIHEGMDASDAMPDTTYTDEQR